MTIDDIASLVESLTHVVHWEFAISFTIGTIIGGFGLYYAVQAYWEAGQAKTEAEEAKNAAKNAGFVVKTQEIMMELERISKVCQLSEKSNYADANDKLIDISGRIYAILGIYQMDNEIKEHITQIETDIETILDSLNTANPSNPQSVVNDATLDPKFLVNYVYNITAPHFLSLVMSLSTLRGVLYNRLINGNG